MFLSTVYRGGKRQGIRLNKTIRSFFGSPWIDLAVRWILGGIFIYVGSNKILAPAVFAKIIYGYSLFPALFINLMAIIVPMLELITGLALIIGFYPRSAALIINAMLLAFIMALSVNLIRGHEFDCGCFSISSNPQEISAWQVIIRDFVILAMGIHVFLYRNTRKLCMLS
ncbi:MAG: MauE/DoxX family redox-associated membrane protein [Desulfobacterales bacterium]|jgi:uncharacterized membrane protein YphA (DoxX/SURF4 family)